MAKKKKKKPTRVPLKIEMLNEQGAGVAFYKKQKIIISKTLPGEEVLVEYHPDRSRKDRIRLVKVTSPSEQRRMPRCRYFEECGGCQLQHLDYPAQLQFKRQLIQQVLHPYPQLKTIRVHPVQGMPEPFHYRNKSQMPFQIQRDRVVFGLYRARTHEVIPIEECLVESQDANQVLRIVRDWANRYHIPVYDEELGKGILRYVLVRKSMFAHKLMIVLVVTDKGIPHWKELLQELKIQLATFDSLQFNINATKSNVILGQENIVAWGEPYIRERIGKYLFRIYPGTFFQINSVQMIKILEKMAAIGDFRPTDRVVDLFSGVGMMALQIAESVSEVIGVDANPQAIEAAELNAADNNIINTKFISGDAAELMERFSGEEQPVDIVITDPPRKGLNHRLIDKIGELNPRAVIYLSCNPRTLARDLARFDELGYRTRELFPFDMFPQTAHVESLVKLVKA